MTTAFERARISLTDSPHPPASARTCSAGNKSHTVRPEVTRVFSHFQPQQGPRERHGHLSWGRACRALGERVGGVRAQPVPGAGSRRPTQLCHRAEEPAGWPQVRRGKEGEGRDLWGNGGCVGAPWAKSRQPQALAVLHTPCAPGAVYKNLVVHWS